MFLCVGKRRTTCLRKWCLHLAGHCGFLKCILPPALQAYPAAKELMKMLMPLGFLVGCFVSTARVHPSSLWAVSAVPAPQPAPTACCLSSSQQGHCYGFMKIIPENDSCTKFNQPQQYFQDSLDISYLILSQITAIFIIWKSTTSNFHLKKTAPVLMASIFVIFQSIYILLFK